MKRHLFYFQSSYLRTGYVLCLYCTYASCSSSNIGFSLTKQIIMASLGIVTVNVDDASRYLCISIEWEGKNCETHTLWHKHMKYMKMILESLFIINLISIGALYFRLFLSCQLFTYVLLSYTNLLCCYYYSGTVKWNLLIE